MRLMWLLLSTISACGRVEVSRHQFLWHSCLIDADCGPTAEIGECVIPDVPPRVCAGRTDHRICSVAESPPCGVCARRCDSIDDCGPGDVCSRSGYCRPGG
jgi:hypothetical protein